MFKNACLTLMLVLFLCSHCFANATVFFKDNTKETGSSVWVEGNEVYLNKSNEVYQFPVDEVLLEETLKFNKIGKYANVVKMDEQSQTGDLVEQIVRISGFDQQIDMIVQMFQSGFESVPGSTPEMRQLLAQALVGFSPEKEKRQIRSYFRSKLDKNTLEAVLAWMKSPLGSKILAAENSNKSVNPETLTEIQKYQDENPPTAQREKLLANLDKAAHISEMTRRMISDIMSVTVGVISKNVGNEKVNHKELKKQTNAKMSEMMPILEKQIQVGMLYTYRDISDSEIEQYIAFLKTKQAQKHVNATYVAIGKMTKTMASVMVKNIIKNVAEMKSQM